MAPSTKRTSLTLAQRVKVIEESDKGKSARKIAGDIGVGKTQIQKILLNRTIIADDFAAGAPSHRRRRTVKKTGFEHVNGVVWEWYKRARSKRVPISGRIVQEKARTFAREVGLDSFAASNGWLESFRKRHAISFLAVCDKSANVNPGIVTDWKGRLAALCKDYQPKDIFNMGESGFLFRALPGMAPAQELETCTVGERSRERLTAVFACSLVGEKLQPLVIGKSAKPQCFQNLDVAKLCVTWRFNEKVWMDSDLFEEWVMSVDADMKRQNRHVLMFLDDAPCHPKINEKLSNVKLQTFPPNTACLQPLDQGIVRHAKANYRKELIRHVLCRIDGAASAADVSQCVDVLQAVTWISKAWMATDPGVITRCFRRAGFPTTTGGDTDDIAAADDAAASAATVDEELATLVLRLDPNASVDEFLDIDSALDTHEHLDAADWEQRLTLHGTHDGDEALESDDSDVADDMPPRQGAVTSYREAVACLDAVEQFAVSRDGSDELHTLLGKVKSMVERRMLDCQ